MTLRIVAGGSAAWVFRKQVFVNRVNRRLVAILLGEVALSFLQRCLAVYAGEELAVAMRADMLLLAGAMFAGGIVYSHLWSAFSVVLVLCGGAMALWPHATNGLFIGSHMAALVVLAIGWRGGAKPSGAADI